MANNLRKFVNPSFLRTCDLGLMRRLMSRHKRALKGFELARLGGDTDLAREALYEFFAGPESGYPDGLVADLHRIAALGTAAGMRVILDRAESEGIRLVDRSDGKEAQQADAKYIALKCFLDAHEVFNTASDLMLLETRVALDEFLGVNTDVPAKLDARTKSAFERAAREYFASKVMGSYCRVGWYHDGNEIKIVVVHGTEVRTEWVVDKKREKVISFRPLGTSVLSYDPVGGHLKVGGLAKAHRPGIAALFATHMLGRPDQFSGESCCDLYTLAPVEERGFSFAFDHRYDLTIAQVRIMEAQANRKVPHPGKARPPQTEWSVTINDRSNALVRMGQVAPTVTFGPGGYRLGHLKFQVKFTAEANRQPSVMVSIEPPRYARFRREVHEAQIMELLRRNGLCVEREPAPTALAAE